MATTYGVNGLSDGAGLGTVATGNLANVAIVRPAGSVLTVHEWDSQAVGYTTTSSSNLTSGNGTAFTTGALTTHFAITCHATVFVYENSGTPGSCSMAVYFHSDATTAAAGPSGDIIGSVASLGGSATSANSGRWDWYGQYYYQFTFNASASTAYTMQLCVHKASQPYYVNLAFSAGLIMELNDA